jgi:hypothetical protein
MGDQLIALCDLINDGQHTRITGSDSGTQQDLSNFPPFFSPNFFTLTPHLTLWLVGMFFLCSLVGLI